MSDRFELLLSVIIPVYNMGHFLPDAIDSIVQQDFDLSSIELILVDDGSTDHTGQVIEEYSQRHAFIQSIRFPENRGAHYAANYPINSAKGEYIHYLSADDFRGKDFLKRSMESLLKHPNIPICSSDPGWSYEKTGRYNLVREPLLPKATEPLVLQSHQIVALLKAKKFWIPGHTTIFKRELLNKYGPFNEKLGERCDWYLVHRAALLNGLVYIPETHSYLYSHTKSYSANMPRQSRREVALEMLHQLDLCPRTSDLFHQADLLDWIARDLHEI